MDPRARDGEIPSSLLPPEQEVIVLPVSVSRATIYGGALAPKAVFPSVRYFGGYNAFRGGSMASDTSDLSIPVNHQSFLLLLCALFNSFMHCTGAQCCFCVHTFFGGSFEVCGMDVRASGRGEQAPSRMASY